MDTLEETSNALLKLESWDPNPESAELLKKFMEACQKPQESYPKFDDATRTQIRTIYNTMIYKQEKECAESIVASEDPIPLYAQYKFNNVVEAAARQDVEYIQNNCLMTFPPKPNVLVIGTGPMNETPIVYEELLDAIVDNVDIEQDAITLSQKVRKALKKEVEGSTYIFGDGATVKFPRAEGGPCYDVVDICGMAGINVAEKQVIVNNVLPTLKTGGLLMVKSYLAPGGHFVFPEIDLNEIKAGNLIGKSGDGRIITFYYRKE